MALHLFECLAGYGDAGSADGPFRGDGLAARRGGDLAGKVVEDLSRTTRATATIADNVGDNVGDVAGMGSDLFGLFAEATCAALVVAAN